MLQEQLQSGVGYLTQGLLPAQPGDVLEMDEVVSFVSEKFFKRFLWTAQCRRTRLIVALAIGDRSETTAKKLWQAIPPAYRSLPVYTDQYNVYPNIVPVKQQHPVPKERATIEQIESQSTHE